MLFRRPVYKKFNVSDELNDDEITQYALQLVKKLSWFSYEFPYKEVSEYDPTTGQTVTKKVSVPWKYLSPTEFLLKRSGISWDFAGYQSYMLDKENIRYNNYFIIDMRRVSEITLDTYAKMCTVIQLLDGEFLYLDTLPKYNRRVYQSDNLEDIFRFIIQRENYRSYRIYDVSEFPSFGCTYHKYLNHCVQTGSLMYHGTEFCRKSRTRETLSPIPNHRSNNRFIL